MQTLDFWHGTVAFGAAFLAGMINSLAGGGTLLTFPALIWLGLNSVAANATSTVALWPFAIGGTIGYRRELRTVDRKMLYLAVPSLVGGLAGAVLLRLTPSSVFDRLVPYLILFATLLFMVQEPLQRHFKPSGRDDAHGSHRSARWFAGALLFQLMVGVYGGYFGAGIGILMLAALSILGMSDIHQMNGLKSVLGGAINAVAALYFIGQSMVYWPYVGIMAIASILGGFLGAGAARRVGRTAVRRIVILIGLGMAVSLFIKK